MSPFIMLAASNTSVHTDVTIGHLSASQATIAMSMGYIAMALFGLSTIVFVVVIYVMAKMRQVEFLQHVTSSRAGIDVLGSLFLSVGWVVAGLSDKTVDGCDVARVALNVFAWCWTLDVLLHYFRARKTDGSTRFLVLGSLVVCVMGATTVLGGLVKYVGLLFAGIAAMIFALPGLGLLGTDRIRTVVYPVAEENKIRFTTNTTSRVIAGVLVLVGIYTLLFELLSNEYTGTLGAGVSFVPMFFSHLTLLEMWAYCAVADFFDSSQAQSPGSHKQLVQDDSVVLVHNTNLMAPDD